MDYPVQDLRLGTAYTTVAPDDPDMRCGAGVNSNTVWYRIIPSYPGRVIADTSGSDYDTVLAIFTGTRGHLNWIACNDDTAGTRQSEVAFDVEAGQTYYIEAASYGSSTSGGALSVYVRHTLFTVRGQVFSGQSTLIPGVTISADTGQTATTNSQGEYTLSWLPGGDRILRASKPGFVFIPNELPVHVPPSLTGQNFIASRVETATPTPTPTSTPTRTPTRTPTLTLTPPPTIDLRVDRIEVSQVFLDDSDPITAEHVPLIAGKETIVRVFVGVSGATSIRNVTGRLDIKDAQNQSHEIKHIELPITAKANPDPYALQDTVNFLIFKQPWLTDSVTFNAEVWAENDDGTRVRESNESNNTREERRTFEQAKPLSIGIVPIYYNYEKRGPDSRQVNAGNHLWAQKVYPTNHINPVPLTTLTLYSAKTQANFKKMLIWNLLNLKSTWEKQNNNKMDAIFGWFPEGVIDIGEATTSYPVAYGDFLPDPQERAQLFAHEVAHLLGRPHPKVGFPSVPPLYINCKNPTPLNDSDWPYSEVNIQVWGIDFDSGRKDPNAAVDYMSYCWHSKYGDKSAWTSPWTYNQVYYKKLKVQSTASIGQFLSTPQPYFTASGLVYSNNTATLDSIWVANTTVPGDNPLPGTDYCLEAQNISGVSLTSRCFDLTFKNDHNGEPQNLDVFFLTLPYPSGVARIVLKKGNQELAVQTVSPHTPVVTVLSPNGGENWSANGAYTITWTATDVDGDSLTYKVLYSPDGSSWMPLELGTAEAQLTVNASELAGGNNARIRVLASDGVNTTAADSAPFTVGRKGPQAFILSPEGDGTIPLGSPLFLQGYAYDLEDGTLGERALHWSSSQDGDLGTGSQVLAALSQGRHVITLTATDSNSNMARASLTVFVGFRIYLPLLLKNHPPRYTISGRVTDNTGTPLSSATITASGPTT